MKTKLLGLLMIGAVAFASAQDRSLLETLVKKGTITEQEAAQIAKDSVVVTPGTSDTKKLSIYGGVSAWYTYGSTDVKSPSGVDFKQDSNGFDLRYVKIGLNAEIQGGWMVDVVTDFGIEGRNRNFLDKVVISKKVAVDYLIGTLDIGLRKVNMGQEQNIDDFALYTPERSIATWFFTRPDAISPALAQKNFGSRAIGIFWDGIIEQAQGMYYGVSIVGGNSHEGSSAQISNIEGNNNLSFYVNVGYKSEQAIENESFTYDFGLNLGYANGGFVIGGTEKNEIWGINPYVGVNWRGLNVMAEYFLQSVQNGDPFGDGRTTPMGFNATVAYKLDVGEWGVFEPVFRASMLATDGMGFDPVAMFFYNNIGYNNYYNRAQTYYIGANWYVVPSVKVSLGYEWGEYSKGLENASGATRAVSNTIRAQLQVLF